MTEKLGDGGSPATVSFFANTTKKIKKTPDRCTLPSVYNHSESVHVCRCRVTYLKTIKLNACTCRSHSESRGCSRSRWFPHRCFLEPAFFPLTWITRQIFVTDQLYWGNWKRISRAHQINKIKGTKKEYQEAGREITRTRNLVMVEAE